MPDFSCAIAVGGVIGKAEQREVLAVDHAVRLPSQAKKSRTEPISVRISMSSSSVPIRRETRPVRVRGAQTRLAHEEVVELERQPGEM